MKNLLSEELINMMSEKVLLEKNSLFISMKSHITPLMWEIFDIKIYLKGEKGLATLTVKISGKGFPYLPDYRLIVKNGTSKKVQRSTKHSMGYVESIQKFKISYLDEVEVLPVTFKFFDPYQEKLREIKTETIRILPVEKEGKKQVKPMSEEEKIKLKIENFKRLHPEFFEKTSFYEKILREAFVYKHYIIGFTALIFFLILTALKRIFQTSVSPSVREITALKIESLNDFKKLYRFFPEKKMSSYLSRTEKLLFKSEIKEIRGKLLYIKSEGKVYTPQKILRMFEEMKWEIIKEKTENLPRKKKTVARLYYLLNRYSEFALCLVMLLLITSFIQFFTEKFPQHWQMLTLINILTGIAFLFYMIAVKRKVIKVQHVRTAK
ncbi:MAG: hypothetical protein Q9M89_09820 [Persephonella sp.]|nr:hypothetical protein [Persephonella sp.]